MMIAGIMGFSSGMPLLLTMSVLQAWMKDEGVDLTVLGITTLLGLPYTIKFVWAPLLDSYRLPFLGRRRGWLLVVQLALALAIAGLGFTDPGFNLWFVAAAALFVAFLSASQDILIDAYRREDLADEELGLGSSMYVYGYRLGMLLASGGGLILADYTSFRIVYLVMAASMSIGVAATLFAPEPPEVPGAPRKLSAGVVAPFVEYFRRPQAVWILVFILAYKIGDTMAGAMTMPFYLDIGFSKTQIGAVVKLFGFWATMAGAFIGGTAMVRLGIYRSLWLFGILQALSTAGFALLANAERQIEIVGMFFWPLPWPSTVGFVYAVKPSVLWLTGVISFENLSAGMGTAAFMAFMASQANKRFTATQYALLTSLMGVPRAILAAPTGIFAKWLGWPLFFSSCALLAIPGLLILLKFISWQRPQVSSETPTS